MILLTIFILAIYSYSDLLLKKISNIFILFSFVAIVLISGKFVVPLRDFMLAGFLISLLTWFIENKIINNGSIFMGGGDIKMFAIISSALGILAFMKIAALSFLFFISIKYIFRRENIPFAPACFFSLFFLDLLNYL